jgi:hypothetical protein
LRFSPSSGLGFLALLPPTISLLCCRLLVVQNPSYLNVPATQISTFCQNIYFCVFILFLCVQNLYLYFHHVYIIKSGFIIAAGQIDIFRAPSGPRAIFWLFCYRPVVK